MQAVTSINPRPSILGRIQRGRQEQPIRLVCMGIEGVGKTTFAAGAPAPIFLPTESGSAHLDIDRLPQPESWADVMASLEALRKESHDYKTFVLDSVTGLEPILHEALCTDNGWKDIESPGFGKGYVAALDKWRIFLREVERLWSDRKMNIILIAHTNVRPFRNPDGDDYERYQLALNDKAAGVIRQWADAVIFARHEAFTKVDSKTKRVKGISSGARVMHTNWSAAFDAKNRYGLPDELPLSWQDFASAIQSNADRITELKAQIAQIAKELGGDAEKKAAEFVEKNKDNAGRLAELANRMTMKFEESKKEQTK